ncbi:four helix bundle protein [Reichenbachiella faecimaris]|uniref:Four helix bundle protein n=1 Tax=Reichenbachiella faecimaris TaxID=692418 RepID=A0A1W2GBA6_REIFA|nr:four helix bundle protein [Reichenbachiella faecimaris]SMD33960.1 four helix bundle protein [Reichenbachiella faecimaris]
MNRYQDLQVWKKSMDLVEEVYAVVKSFPNDEKFGLISQIRRCAVSIPSNIAEGSGRTSKKEFAHFLSIATGSLFELNTQIQISTRIGYLKNEKQEVLTQNIDEIHRMLFGLMTSLK